MTRHNYRGEGCHIGMPERPDWRQIILENLVPKNGHWFVGTKSSPEWLGRSYTSKISAVLMKLCSWPKVIQLIIFSSEIFLSWYSHLLIFTYLKSTNCLFHRQLPSSFLLSLMLLKWSLEQKPFLKYLLFLHKLNYLNFCFNLLSAAGIIY